MSFGPNADPHLPVEIKFDNDVMAGRATHPVSSALPFSGPMLKGRATCLPKLITSKDIASSDTVTINRLLGTPSAPADTEAHILHLLLFRSLEPPDTIIDENKKFAQAWLQCFTFSSDTDNIITRVLGAGNPPDSNTEPPRALRLLLFCRLEPMDTIIKEDKFTKAWLQCFACHYSLWENGIQHGDISIWSLMWDPVDNCGVLNDFDLSAITGSAENRRGEPTGTLPFMAQKLLVYEPESFVWTLAWLCLRNIPLGIMEWRKGDFDAVIGAKVVFIHGLNSDLVLPNQYKYTVTWRKCCILLRLLCDLDAYQSFRKARDMPQAEPDSQDVYYEVMNIIRTEYTPDDGDDFLAKLRAKARQEVA
ncbi:hypothetical protein BDQ17DRAFT_1431115 [Cyathus striatus]|nr:hypothetical protein BDQ17DRAFT_1431115 [Cyathus striatus]